MLDGGEARHAAIEIARRAFGQKAFREADEGSVHVVRRDCRGDAVDIGGRQGTPPGVRVIQVLWTLFGQHIARKGARLQLSRH